MVDFKEAAKATAQAAKEAAQPTIDAMKSSADQAGQAINEGMKSAQNYVGSQAENAAGGVSSGLKSAAGAIRDNVSDEGAFGQSARGVAQSFSNAAGYLDQKGAKGIAEDLAVMIKNNPIPALLIGFGLGFLIARGTDSRS